MKKRAFFSLLGFTTIALFAIVPALIPKAIGADWPYAVLVANHTTDADVYMYVYTGASKEEDCLRPGLSKRLLFQESIRSVWVSAIAKGTDCHGPALEKFGTSVPDEKGVMMTYKVTGKDGRYEIAESSGPFHP